MAADITAASGDQNMGLVRHWVQGWLFGFRLGFSVEVKLLALFL